MTKSLRTRWGIALLGLASVYFVLVYILPMLPASTQGASATAIGTCIHRQQHLIANGRSPSGKHWTVTATIRNDGSCDAWFFGMGFAPSGTSAGSWSGGWRIPAGGHLSTNFTIGAQDEAEGPERAFSGTAGVTVKTVVLTTSNGKRLRFHPKLPSERLRKRFVWLRNVRYFLRYYPTGQHVKTAMLLNSRGALIYTEHGEEGEFDGPM
jgi:hypothetical protein